MKKHKLKNQISLHGALSKIDIELISIYRGESKYLLKMFYRDPNGNIQSDLQINKAVLMADNSFYLVIVSNGHLLDIFDFHKPSYSNLRDCFKILASQPLFQQSVLSILKFIAPIDMDRSLSLIQRIGFITNYN